MIWIGVISHWLMDFIVHRPDLPLYSGSRLVGLGLWNYRWATIALEVSMFALAIWIFLRQTKAKTKIGSYGLWAFVILLLAAYAVVAFGPPPPTSKKAIALGALSSLVFIAWAWWLDRHRELKETEPVAHTGKVKLAGG